MLFVCYPKCSTCMKAKKWLDEKGIDYEMRDIRQDNPNTAELKEWWEKSGLPLKKFFNTSGNLYKSMNLKDRLPQMSEEEQISLLSEDGMLVKRPILVTDSAVLTGFREKEWGLEGEESTFPELSPQISRWGRPARCAHPGSGRPGTGRRCSGRGRPCCAPHSGRRPGRRRPCSAP